MTKKLLILFVAAGLAVGAAAGPQAPSQTRKPAQAKPVQLAPLDINNATQIQLEKLPGITRLLAKKIIANGPYLKVDDIARAGVPKGTIERIRPLVTVDGTMPANHPVRRPPAPAKRKGADPRHG